MGMVIRFPRSHVRASSKAGRCTPTGQASPSGHCSENQIITSSYLRAVKVLPPSSLKKRQSPAAKRPSVAKETLRASAYAEAQSMRFDRSSVSIVKDDSRKIPTTQAKSVGNFRLDQPPVKSDKSALSSVEEVRNRIRRAIEGSGDKPVTLALEWGFERNHIRDFLEAKKDSLKPEVLAAISERYGIPFPMLIIKRQRKKRKVA